MNGWLDGWTLFDCKVKLIGNYDWKSVGLQEAFLFLI